MRGGEVVHDVLMVELEVVLKGTQVPGRGSAGQAESAATRRDSL
jgi:hypothetical protein